MVGGLGATFWGLMEPGFAWRDGSAGGLELDSDGDPPDPTGGRTILVATVIFAS